MMLANCICRFVRPSRVPCGSLRQLHHANKKNYRVRLHKIGTIEEPNVGEEPYPPGTLFLHKIFPYRGVIVHSWEADVHETKITSKLVKTLLTKDNNPVTSKDNNDANTQTTRTRQQFYYMVLPDMRDVPHIKIETLFVQGDYVLHEDILPYACSESTKPVQHPAFNTLFSQDPTNDMNYLLRDNVDALNTALLPTDVYREVTEKVRVTVTPIKLKWKFQQITKQHMWQYYLRIQNLGTTPVTLRERVWKIADKENVLVTVKGKGVVGKEPVLSKSSPAFQYSSFCTLESSSGWMWGKFILERENGSKFECKIPKFQLKGEDNEIEDSDPDPPNNT